jgi:hypothetical protein
VALVVLGEDAVRVADVVVRDRADEPVALGRL